MVKVVSFVGTVLENKRTLQHSVSIPSVFPVTKGEKVKVIKEVKTK